MRSLVSKVADKGPAADLIRQELQSDLARADELIAAAITEASWARMGSWVMKYAEYVRTQCPLTLHFLGMSSSMVHEDIALGFLASVASIKPFAKTRVDAARRAINKLRSMAGLPPLTDASNIAMLVSGAKKGKVSSKKQSPAMTLAFVTMIAKAWGSSQVWWQRQVALMVLLAFCTLARGGEVVAVPAAGVTWVHRDGTHHRGYHPPNFHCHDPACTVPSCIRGALILATSRKTRQSEATWIPVIDSLVLSLLARHLRWLRVNVPGAFFLFLARRPTVTQGVKAFAPSNMPRSHMSTSSFRFLLRRALVECCHLSQQQADQFGTHDMRIACRPRSPPPPGRVC